MNRYALSRKAEDRVKGLLGGEFEITDDNSYDFLWNGKKIAVVSTASSKIGKTAYRFNVKAADAQEDLFVILVAFEELANDLYWIVRGSQLEGKVSYYAKVAEAISTSELKDKLLNLD